MGTGFPSQQVLPSCQRRVKLILTTIPARSLSPATEAVLLKTHNLRQIPPLQKPPGKFQVLAGEPFDSLRSLIASGRLAGGASTVY